MAADPDPFTVGAAADWIEALRESGPPSNGVRVWDDDDLYIAQVPRTSLIARYYVIVHELLIVLDRLDAA
ncbi:MAG TPA: hypothetical protein VFH56_13435 [Acidimicrobiales bacterium]|nr:hypothetical protein [Acidimicrobiales bacterium]